MPLVKAIPATAMWHNCPHRTTLTLASAQEEIVHLIHWRCELYSGLSAKGKGPTDCMPVIPFSVVCRVMWRLLQ